MASEQFSLCWDNFHKNMSSGMNSLLENEDLVDVTLAVEGKYLKAHKMVLSVCSPYFRELFKMNPCKHPIVFMKDVSYIAMSDLLQFMYQGEVQVSQDNLTTFIKTAEALQIKGLTGDGNGSAECDNDQDEPRPAEIEPPKMTAPPPRPKKVHQTPTPPAKRPRLSVPEQASAQQTIAKTEPAAVSSAPSNENLIQFKMEPYDQGQSTVTIPDDNTDETFTDDPLDETNADDGNEDYSMMEGGDEEPQAGTSADGTAGEGQDGKSVPVEYTPRFLKSGIIINGFTYHQNTVKKDSKMRYLICSEYKRLSCKARAQIPIGGTVNDVILRREHNHPPFKDSVVKNDFLAVLKTHTDCRPTAPLKQIYEGAAILNPEGAELCPYRKVVSSMRRWRQIAMSI
ncbi:protein tramtrack, beta isoform-like isoform X8 [Zophobas morio]|uniref:protein tramtrack, beta isoform-like isoform X8 n=1 Tax=Zophobas morio TaxID=2755281 RepID=UPI00308332D0